MTQKMLGSEKQIKWATDIRANIIMTFQNVIDEFTPMATTNRIVQENIDYLQTLIDLLNAENVHAGDIIDLFKRIRFSGDYREDFMKIKSVYKIEVPCNKGQRTLLMYKEPPKRK